MNRHSLTLLGLLGTAALAAPTSANAQLTAQLGQGWSLTFSGNVNAHAIYLKSDANGDLPGGTPGALIPAGPEGFSIRTGMSPAMASFSVKGKDGGRDLGATITFAPQIQCGGGTTNCAGPQIDTRQAFLTVGGVHGGTILAGRDLGLFGRQNFLNDMTMYGTGVVDFGGSGTTLGRFGTGYNYPNYNAQVTWMSAAGKPTSFAIGVFDPDAVAGGATKLPRVEAEWTKTSAHSSLWINGLWETQDVGTSFNSTAIGGGYKWWNAKQTWVASGFYGSGIGTTINFAPDAVGTGGDERSSWGVYGQGTFKMSETRTFGISAGQNVLQGGNGEPSTIVTNRAFVAGLYNKVSRMLRTDLELTYATSEDDASGNNSQWNISSGVMLMW